MNFPGSGCSHPGERQADADIRKNTFYSFYGKINKYTCEAKTQQQTEADNQSVALLH